MDAKRHHRWLRACVMTMVATMFATMVRADYSGDPTPVVRTDASSASSIFSVHITNNLFEPPVRTEVAGGQLSGLLRLSGSHTYRVRVSPSSGNGYALELTDEDGHELDSALVHDDATATFRRFGVQVHVFSLGHPGPGSGS